MLTLLRPLLTAVLLATLSTSAVVLASRPPQITKGEPSDTPIALSDPDGQDLTLEELSVNAAVHGMLSLTELELRFKNPQARRIEGRFSCVLPAGAAISRFAKEVGGQLMEGEVVERLKANQVYDAILHEMRDPALLEQDQGNRFSARIFPIEANASVRIVLSYSRLLPLENGVRTFDLPLRGLPTIGRFRFHGLFSPLPGEEVQAPASSPVKHVSPSRLAGPGSAASAIAPRTLDLEESDLTPEHDLSLSWRPTEAAAAVRVLRAGDFVLTSFRSPVPARAASSTPRPWVFFVDTSASGAEAMAPRIRALEALLAALPAGDAVELVAFDQDVETLGKRSAAEWAKRIGPALEKRGFFGGTDLGSALERLARIAAGRSDARFVLVSDGVATMGKTSPAELASILASRAPRASLSAVVLGSRQDEATLEALVAGRGRIVTIPLGEAIVERAHDAARRLPLPVGPTLQLLDPSAEWSYPSVVHDVQPGAEIVLLSKLKPGLSPGARLVRDGKMIESVKRATELQAGTYEPLLSREAYRAYLRFLADRESAETQPAVRTALANEQVRVSVEQRVLVPGTTLLVLETENDYARFGLDRRALASILTVGVTGVARLDRHDAVAIARRPVVNERERVAAKEDGRTRREQAQKARAFDGQSSASGAKLEANAKRRVDDMAAALKDVEGDSIGASAQRIEGGVPGGSEGGVEGGVAGRAMEMASGGGVAGGTVPDAPPARSDAPRGQIVPDLVPPLPAPVAAGPVRQATNVVPPAEEQLRSAGSERRAESRITRPDARPVAVSAPSWTTPPLRSQAEIERLTRDVEARPRDRAAYNALSDALLRNQEWKRLRELARRWQPYDPENPQVYECLGEAAFQLGLTSEAARAFGSLVEIAPGKTELLQRAGLLLFRAGARRLAEFPLRRALELRPDRVNGYRHLALVLWQDGRIEEAAGVLERGAQQTFPDWYGNAKRVLVEELAYVYRAWIAESPEKTAEVRARASAHGADLARTDALRVTLAWETDANDVDLHVVDPRGEECFYSHRATATGLELYEDITRGLGPEVIRTRSLAPGTYAVGVNYFSAGPMGISRGVLAVMRPGAGKNALQIVPFRLVEGGRDMRLLARIDVGVEEKVKVARVAR